MTDLIDRQEAIIAVGNAVSDGESWYRALKNIPSACEQEFEWCNTCKEYDQEKHCCFRWSKVINKTAEELRASYGDSVSKESVINALDDLCDRVCQYTKKQRYVMCGSCPLGLAFEVIEQLPVLGEIVNG